MVGSCDMCLVVGLGVSGVHEFVCVLMLRFGARMSVARLPQFESAGALLWAQATAKDCQVRPNTSSAFMNVAMRGTVPIAGLDATR